MRRIILLTAVLALTTADDGAAQVRRKDAPQKPVWVQLPLPGRSLPCDVAAWAEFFQVLKVTYNKDDDEIVFLLRAKSDLNFTHDGQRGNLACPARFVDAENVNMTEQLNIRFDPNPRGVKKGESVRCFLTLPDEEILKKTKKVVTATKR